MKNEIKKIEKIKKYIIQKKTPQDGVVEPPFSSHGTLKEGGQGGWGSQISTFYRTTILSKASILYCSHKWPETFPHSYALLCCLVFYKNAFL